MPNKNYNKNAYFFKLHTEGVNRNGLLTGKGHFSTATRVQELLEAEKVIMYNDQIVDISRHF